MSLDLDQFLTITKAREQAARRKPASPAPLPVPAH
jgi:hypothetical protein